MRTTVTIDPAPKSLLLEEVRRVGITPLFPAEFAPVSFNRLADELDDETTLREFSA